MRKIGIIIGFIVLTSSAFGQQFLWSTVNDSISKYVPLDNVTNEVLKFYDQYEYYFDFAGFSKDGFFELFESFEISSDDWKDIKSRIYDIEDLTIFAFRGNLGRGSVIFIMCISKSDVNMLLFSNAYESDAIRTHRHKREQFTNWFSTLNNNLVGSESKSDHGATFRREQGGSTGAGMGLSSGAGVGEGSGKGVGYGSGNRAFVNIPDVNINEAGVVYVEIHVTAQGNVINARILSTEKYPTTITNPKIQQECLARALSAKYVVGKEELRVIVFK